MPNALQIHLGGRGGVPRGKQVHCSVADGSTFWSRSSQSSAATCGRYGNTVLVRNGTERKRLHSSIPSALGASTTGRVTGTVGLNFHFRLVQGVRPSVDAGCAILSLHRQNERADSPMAHPTIPRGWQLPCVQQAWYSEVGKIFGFSTCAIFVLLNPNSSCRPSPPLISTWHLHRFGDRSGSQAKTSAAQPPLIGVSCVINNTESGYRAQKL